MKRIVTIFIASICGLIPLNAQGLIAEPNTTFLPVVLDSVVQLSCESEEWNLETRRIYTYDNNGKLITEDIHGWIEDYLIGDSYNVYTYDQVGNLIKVERSGTKRNVKNCCWPYPVDFVEIEGFIYDPSGHLKERIFEQESKFPRRQKFYYNISGDLSERIGYIWDPETQVWLISSIEDNTYNVEDKLSETKTFDWQVTYSTSSDGYASAGVDDEACIYRLVHSYNTQGQLINKTRYYYYPWNNKELKDWRTSYAYDDRGDMIRETHYLYENDENNKEQEVEYYLNSYDTYGNLSERNIYEWDWESNTMNEVYREIYSYDQNGRVKERLRYGIIQETDEWNLINKAFAYWSVLTNNNQNTLEQMSLLVYPNPTNDFITIQLEDDRFYFLEIHTLNGQMILNRECEGSLYQIDLTSFSKGIYVITIRSKKFVRTEKIIKQ